jgi:hypothetical protein
MFGLRQTEHPAACPPRTVFPVNSRAGFDGFVSPQHVRFAFGHGGDQPGYVNFRLKQLKFPSTFLVVIKIKQSLPANG